MLHGSWAALAKVLFIVLVHTCTPNATLQLTLELDEMIKSEKISTG